MYIEPNTNIKIIKLCPLDLDQNDTIYFTSKEAQTNFFINTLPGYYLQRNSYQRVNKGTMRVARNAESLYNCNYLAFQNASFGDKWFYAFITKIEYINNETSEITYQLDVMQTWHFDYTLMQCFVEREHSVTDEIGDNLVPESLETGEMISEEVSEINELKSLDIAFWCPFDRQGNPIGGYKLNQGFGVFYQGVAPIRFRLNDSGIDEAIAWLNGLDALNVTKIVALTVIPTIADQSTPPIIAISKKQSMIRSDGTNVKNNKCLTYPYNSLYVTNLQGKTAVYRYEFFAEDEYHECDFELFCDVSPKCSAILTPLDYKGVAYNFDEKIDLSAFPQIAYNIDSFKAWLAQSASSIAMSVFNTGMGAANIYAGNPSGVIQAEQGVSQGVGIALQGAIHSLMPPQSRGYTGAMTMLARNKLTFIMMKKHITPEFATIIDDYFSMYGYATHKVKIPNRNARPEWNFVKTNNCKIDGTVPDGGLPASDAKEIEAIYDRGIRFWNNPAHIGNYSYDNSPTIGGE